MLTSTAAEKQAGEPHVHLHRRIRGKRILWPIFKRAILHQLRHNGRGEGTSAGHSPACITCISFSLDSTSEPLQSSHGTKCCGDGAIRGLKRRISSRAGAGGILDNQTNEVFSFFIFLFCFWMSIKSGIQIK